MSKSILLVDDDLAPGATSPSGNYMWYYAQALRDKGYELTEVNSTDAALQALKKGTFNLVILDIMMPPGDAYADADTDRGLLTGLVLAESLREQHPEIPVLILSNVENDNTIRKLNAKENIKQVLNKPDYAPFRVVEEVNKVIGE